MKYLFILLFAFQISHAQIDLHLTASQDLTFDYYRGLGASWVSAEIANHFTKRPFLSGVIGLAAGVGQSFLDRGSQGRIISSIGASTGIIFCYPIRLDCGREKAKKLEEVKKMQKARELAENYERR